VKILIDFDLNLIRKIFDWCFENAVQILVDYIQEIYQKLLNILLISFRKLKFEEFYTGNSFEKSRKYRKTQ